MEDNQTSLARLQTSLQTEMRSVTQKYGDEYVKFLHAYPTLRKREDLITTSREAVRKGGMSFAQIDNYFAKGASEWWIKVMLIDTFSFIGAMENIATFQVKGLAARIRQEYYFMTPSELTYFFYSFSMGDFGEMYTGKNINPQRMLMALKSCNENLQEERIKYEQEKVRIKKEKEAEQDRREVVDFEEYKRLKGLPKDYKNPFERLKDAVININKSKD